MFIRVITILWKKSYCKILFFLHLYDLDEVLGIYEGNPATETENH